MSRHAAPRASDSARTTTASRPERRTSAGVAGVLVAVIAVAFAAVTVSGIALAGVDLAPRGPAATTPTPTPTPTVVAAALTTSPAAKTVVGTLGGGIATGWAAASSTAYTAGTPFDEPCGRPSSAGAVISASRDFVVGAQQVIVTLAAYSAGQGAVALAGWKSVLGECEVAGKAGRVTVAGPGADGVVAWLRATGSSPASMLMWRRGDVVAVVAQPTAAPTGLAERAAQVDTALLGALVGRCADIGSTLADAARSPWVARDQFTGLTQPITVVGTPSPAPTPPPGVAAVAPTYSPAPLPSVSLPTQPAEPIWPSALPAPVAPPVAPARPAPVPASTAVPERVDDPVGPGCGWAFTGQVKPPYDAGAEQTLAAQRVAQAQLDLVAAQGQWQADTVTYWQSVPAYEAQATLFRQYAESVRSVARAWDTIARQRTAYDAALAAYAAAAAARDAFLAEQSAARSAYDTAVALCGGPPTGSPTPSDTALPSPAPTPGDPGVPGCPPVVPPILYQSPPLVPDVPTPPPDPRPASAIPSAPSP